MDGPEFNGVVELAFSTGYGQVRAMLKGGRFFEKNRSAFWAEAASTAADLDDILAYKSGKPSDFFNDGKEPKYSNHLQDLGELGVVAKGGKKKMKGKLDNRGDIFLPDTLKNTRVTCTGWLMCRQERLPRPEMWLLWEKCSVKFTTWRIF